MRLRRNMYIMPSIIDGLTPLNRVIICTVLEEDMAEDSLINFTDLRSGIERRVPFARGIKRAVAKFGSSRGPLPLLEMSHGYSNYIAARAHPYLLLVFNELDTAMLKTRPELQKYFGDKRICPEDLMPIIPLVLINNRSVTVEQAIEWLICKLSGEPLPRLPPLRHSMTVNMFGFLRVFNDVRKVFQCFYKHRFNFYQLRRHHYRDPRSSKQIWIDELSELHNYFVANAAAPEDAAN